MTSAPPRRPARAKTSTGTTRQGSSALGSIALRRMVAQQLHGSRLTTPAELVAWLGAVQAQDYGGAKWALGQRLDGVSDADLDRAFAAGEILRTHVLRPTWHLVAPADLRWMIALTGPRVAQANGYQAKRLGLVAADFRRSEAALRRALRGGKQLTRAEVAAVLGEAGIDLARTERLGCLLMQAEVEAVICSGALRGKQHTYALFDDRVPEGPPFDRAWALAELAGRYFASHGPATIENYAGWSGLTMTDAKAGLEGARHALASTEQDAKTYWSPRAHRDIVQEGAARLRLLPNYDEYLVAYADRGEVLGGLGDGSVNARGNILFHNTVVSAGAVVGRWSRTSSRREVVVSVVLFRPLSRAETRALKEAAAAYGAFLGLPAGLVVNAGAADLA